MNTKLILFLLSFFAISCSNNPHLSTRSGDSTQSAITESDNSANTNNTTTTCGSGVAGTGLSCTGTTADGNSCGQIPIGNYTVKLAGRQGWYPQRNTSYLYPQKQETELRFKSDGRLRVRVKVNPQPEPFRGHTDPSNPTAANQIHNCAGRVGGADNPGSWRYQKVSLNVNFYSSTLSGGKWIKNNLLYSQYLKGIAVNKCSNIVDLPAEIIKSTPNPILVEITNVSNDLHCHTNGSYCPSERIMRPQECYNVVVQVANDTSDDFK